LLKANSPSMKISNAPVVNIEFPTLLSIKRSKNAVILLFFMLTYSSGSAIPSILKIVSPPNRTAIPTKKKKEKICARICFSLGGG